jgi:Domain of Unknown Function (DUF748)
MSTADSAPRKTSRLRKILYGLAGAVVLYAILGFLVAPAVIKAQMLKRLPVILKRPVTVEQVAVNPFTLSLTITNFAVNEKDGSPFAGWDQVYAQLSYSSFFQHGWTVKEISLTHPFAHISRARDGKLNFDDILAALASQSPSTNTPATKSPMPLVIIDVLQIDNANATVDDFVPAQPVHTKILPAHLRLDNLSTEPGAHNPYNFTATSDTGESFQWLGAFTLDPPQVKGNFTIKELDLKKYSPYVAPFAKAEITDGRLNVSANYTAGLGSNGLDLSVEKMEVLLKALAVKSTLIDETVVKIPSLEVSLAEADLGKKLVHVTSFRTSEGSLLVRQEKDGKINLLEMLGANSPTNGSAGASPYPAGASTPWTLMVDNVAVDRYSVAVEDKKPAKAAKLSVHDIGFKAKGFSTSGNAPIATDVALELGELGRFTAKGEVKLQPPSAELEVQLVGLDLRQFQPYVEQQVKLAVTSGLLSVAGHAVYQSGKGSPLATFAGDVGLTNFATTDLLHFKDFVKFNALAVSGIKFALEPNNVEVKEVKLEGLNTSVLVDSNKQINLLTVLPAGAPTNPATSPHAAASGPSFPVALESFVFDNAAFHFSDQSIEPNCFFDIQQFGGSVKGLSSKPDSRAVVDVHGNVNEVSTFSVSGGANVLSTNLVMQVAVACKNVDLSPFTPYMEKFGGYPLQRGKLLVDLSYEIANRNLSASNHVTVAGLTLGAHNQSPNATHLPVKLGVALLKNREGNILLDVPLSGRLDDPKFRVMPIVWQVVMNILEKAATSPFTLLGAMFGGGGEELSYVDFQPGQAEIAATEQEKITKLAAALYDRPALHLEITGAVDPLTDGPALARMKLAEQIRSLRAQELIAAGTPAENVQVDATNYTRLLTVLYGQTFGTNVNTNSIATNLVAEAATTNQAVTTPHEDLQFRGIHKGGQAMLVKPGMEDAAGKDTQTYAVTIDLPKLTHINDAANATNMPAAPAPIELPLAQMEEALIGRMEITPNNLRELMSERGRSVQAALVKTGKVEGERMDILAPKPMEPGAKGAARANLSLD